jgi:hypothetical protein
MNSVTIESFRSEGAAIVIYCAMRRRGKVRLKCHPDGNSLQNLTC